MASSAHPTSLSKHFVTPPKNGPSFKHTLEDLLENRIIGTGDDVRQLQRGIFGLRPVLVGGVCRLCQQVPQVVLVDARIFAQIPGLLFRNLN